MQTLFGSSLSPVVCGRAMLYLFNFFCLRIAVSNTYCVVFLFCVLLPVSLDCPFLIARSVFSNVYLCKLGKSDDNSLI